MDAFNNPSEVVARLYDAVLTPQEWPAALEAMADAMRADHVIAMTQRRASRAIVSLAAARVAPNHLTSFSGAVQSGSMDWFLRGAPSETAFQTSAAFPQAALLRSDFYNDIVRPMNGYYGAALLSATSVETGRFFVACRPKRADDYERSEIDRLQLFAPHIMAAMRLRDRLAEAEATAHQALDILNDVDIGVILLDDAGGLRFVNRLADLILRENDGLGCSRAGLIAATSTGTRQLRRLIASAADGQGLAGVGNLLLHLGRPSGRQPLLIRAMPLSRRSADGMGRADCRVALFVRDPDRGNGPDTEAVAAVFGLTPRETEVVTMLALGSDLPAISQAMDVSVSTVRTHLQHIFVKTGATRQGELIRLVLNLRR